MPADIPLYALPLPGVSHNASKSVKKRKRKEVIPAEDASDPEVPEGAVEYSAVITPEERAQRRLAGQPLDANPPPFPFPHAPTSAERSLLHDTHSKPPPNSSASLRVQHLAAMMALLHKSLGAKDYMRASRALALILRTEVYGKPIDMRNAGLWGIGAELLFRFPSESGSSIITREGFEKAKLFYDRMSLQHPWHRSWPSVVNVQDFKIAYFGLWIYVVDQESKRLLGLDNDDGENQRELFAKEWEATEADKIAREMDALMNTLPFMDDPELIRLRAMVALWIADLAENIDGLHDESIDPDAELERAWMGEVEIGQNDDRHVGNSKAEAAKVTAKNLFSRLRNDGLADTYLD